MLQAQSRAPAPKLQAKPRPVLKAKAPAANPLQAKPAAQPAAVRPLIVQAIAKSMQKLLAQRQFLSSPNESDALQPGTQEAKIASRTRG